MTACLYPPFTSARSLLGLLYPTTCRDLGYAFRARPLILGSNFSGRPNREKKAGAPAPRLPPGAACGGSEGSIVHVIEPVVHFFFSSVLLHAVALFQTPDQLITLAR